jgi:hypothetical protein
MGMFTDLIEKDIYKEAGVEFISSEKDKVTVKLSCGHLGTFYKGNVKKKLIKCNICFYDKRRKNIEDAGLISHIPIEEIMEHIKSDYTFKNCGHTKNMLLTSAIGANFCDECDFQLRSEHLIKQGWTALREKSSKYSCTVAICNTCNTTRDVYNDTAKNGKIVCIPCRTAKTEENQRIAGDKFGFKYVSRDVSRGKDYFFFELPCSHIISVRNSSILKGSVKCHHCEKSKINSQFIMYVLKIDTPEGNFCKVGITEDINKRLFTFGSKNCKVNVLYVSNSRLFSDARSVEQEIFTIFKHERVNPDIAKKYFKNGFTEFLNQSTINDVLKIVKDKMNNE